MKSGNGFRHSRKSEMKNACARACLALGLALVLPIAAGAQATPRQEPSGSFAGGQSTYAIEGRVVDARGRVPLEGVRVTLSGVRGVALSYVHTDSEGNFVFYRLPQGRYDLNFSGTGYQERSLSVALEAGPQSGLVVEMSPRGGGGNGAAEGVAPVWALKIPAAAQKKYAAGMEALRKGNRKKCIAELEAAIQLYPDYAGAYAALASARLGEGDTPGAAAAFEKALEIDDTLPEANFGLGVLRSSQREFDAAEKLLLRAAQARPGDAHVRYELGQLYLRRENFSEAEAHLRQALGLREDHPRTHLLLINSLALQERLTEALAAMEEFLKRFPADAFAAQVRAKRDAIRAHLASK